MPAAAKKRPQERSRRRRRPREPSQAKGDQTGPNTGDERRLTQFGCCWWDITPPSSAGRKCSRGGNLVATPEQQKATSKAVGSPRRTAESCNANRVAESVIAAATTRGATKAQQVRSKGPCGGWPGGETTSRWHLFSAGAASGGPGPRSSTRPTKDEKEKAPNSKTSGAKRQRGNRSQGKSNQTGQ